MYPSEFEDKILEYKQEVYLILLKNNARTLRNFIGVYENSIFKYLEVICRSVVSNSFKSSKNRYRTVSIDELMEKEGVATAASVEETANEFLKRDLLSLMRRSYHKKNQRHLSRNMGIFRLYFFMGFTTKQISHFRFAKLSSSGVDTVISRLRAAVSTAYKDFAN